MSSITPKQLIAGQYLTTAAATYYTTGANLNTNIQKLTFTNVTGTARTVTVRLVVSGGTGSASNTIALTRTVPANDYWDCDVAQGHWLEPGGFIELLAEANSAIVVFGSGLEVAV